jgi:hypothetical protein
MMIAEPTIIATTLVFVCSDMADTWPGTAKPGKINHGAADHIASRHTPQV